METFFKSRDVIKLAELALEVYSIAQYECYMPLVSSTFDVADKNTGPSSVQGVI